jgi:hypothetical protein
MDKWLFCIEQPGLPLIHVLYYLVHMLFDLCLYTTYGKSLHKTHGYTSNPQFCSEVLGQNCVYKAQLLHQFVMFTVNHMSLHNSSICRDYQFTTDHQKSYLTPNSKANSNANSNADINADAAVNTTGPMGLSKLEMPLQTALIQYK